MSPSKAAHNSAAADETPSERLEDAWTKEPSLVLKIAAAPHLFKPLLESKQPPSELILMVPAGEGFQEIKKVIRIKPRLGKRRAKKGNIGCLVKGCFYQTRNR